MSSCNLGTLTYWNSLGHSRPVTGLLYLLLHDENCRERLKLWGKEEQKRNSPCALYEGVWGWRYRSTHSYNSTKEVCGEDGIKVCLTVTGCVGRGLDSECPG